VLKTQRFAGDPAAQRLLMALIGTGAIAPTYGIYDWFAGEDTGVNSGEVPLNYLISSVPGVTASAGSALSMLDPDTRMGFNSYELERKLAKVQAGTPMDGGGTAVDLNELNRIQEEIKKGYGGRVEAMMAKDKALSYDDALSLLRNRATRRALAGAIAGTAAGTVPAIQWMQDAPKTGAVAP
jgi:hypothetical protein